MGSIYPNGIFSWVDKRNLYDDVDANDINDLAHEIIAIETQLGALMNALTMVENEVDQTDADLQSLDNNLSRTIITKFNSLKDQLNWIALGKQAYGAEATASNVNLPITPKNRPYPPNLITLDEPATGHDPMSMWNGTGFTLKTGGLWMMAGHVEISLQSTGPNDNDNFGTYEASITLNGSRWTRGLDRRYPDVDGYWHDVFLEPSCFGWFPAGTRVTLRAAQSSNLPQTISFAALSVIRLRAYND